MKACRYCKEEKSLGYFRTKKRKDGSTYYFPDCVKCESKKSAERKKVYYQNNEEYREKEKLKLANRRKEQPDKIVLYRMRNAAKALGLDPDAVIEYYHSHDRVCDICKGVNQSGRSLAIDHCHLTGKFRGLLCSECNLMLGKAKDSQRILISAIDYLNRNS